MCFVVTCWERADLLALVCGVFCEFVTFPLVSWVRCGTWLYRFLIFAPLLTSRNRQDSMAEINTKHKTAKKDPQKRHCLRTVCKEITGGLKNVSLYHHHPILSHISIHFILSSEFNAYIKQTIMVFSKSKTICMLHNHIRHYMYLCSLDTISAAWTLSVLVSDPICGNNMDMSSNTAKTRSDKRVSDRFYGHPMGNYLINHEHFAGSLLSVKFSACHDGPQLPYSCLVPL